MARIRTIKPSIFSSLTVNSWPIPVRWTFAGLWTYLDDSGRGVDEVRLVKAELYPLDDAMTLKKVAEHLSVIEQSSTLCRYKVAGQAYMHITSWREHQRINRPTGSKFPPCPKHDKGGDE
jgi:hypothetical protein